MYKEKIYFHLPGLFRNYIIYNNLISIYKDHREYFYENACIGSVYGSPEVPWNGGRLMISGKPELQELRAIKEFMFRNKIPVRFTFTNNQLKDYHLKDDYCNELLKVFNTGTNEIICNSPLLENYIRDKYKNNYKYISSTTKCIKNISSLENELNSNYYITVLDYNFNNNFEKLKDLPNKEKCEILCNPVCNPGCSRRMSHYIEISKCQLLGVKGNFSCSFSGLPFYEAQKSPLFVSKENINDNYIPLGYKHFKLEGRTAKYFDLIEILCYYLIKPEYSLIVREQLMSLLYS